MMRSLVAAALLALLSQDGTGVLRIDVVALDRENRPVTGLSAADIEVWLSGRRLPVQSMTAVSPGSEGREGRLFVLLLDDLTIEPVMVNRIRDAGRKFLARLSPGDRIAVARLSGGLTEITSDAARARRRIDSFNQSVALLPLDRLSVRLLESLTAIAHDVSEAPERRKVIVAVGSGWLFDRPIPPPHIAPDVRREWTAAVRAMGRADVALYIIDPGGVGANRIAGGGGFARETGGHAFINTNDVAGAIERIFAETDRYYEVIVEDPPFGGTAELRELDVRSRHKDVTVRARRWLPGKVQNP